MAGKTSRWTPERIREVHAAVIDGKEKRLTIREIAETLSNRWGEPFPKTNLDAFLQHHPLSGRDTVERDTIPGGMPPAEPVEPAESVGELQEAHADASEVNALRKAKKMLLEELRVRDAQIANLLELRRSKPLPPIEHFRKPGSQRQGVPVMLLSDLHVEEGVTSEKTNGLNEYNLDIAAECLDACAESYAWMLQDSRFDCRTGVVWIGGDTFSGYIHEELVEANFLSPVQAVLWLQEHLEKMLRKIAALCPNLERIIVPCNDGNHGRNTHKMRVSTRTENSLEWLMYQTLAARMSDDPRFEFQIADAVWNYLEVYNTSIAFGHGDVFRSMGGVGGVLIPIKKGFNERAKYRKLDLMCIGHFHQRLDAGNIIVNGSMIGVNPYAISINCAPEPRQQSWFLIDSEHGKCLSAPVWLPAYKP